ncbi:ABC transporter ATP-binding protein [Corynebacterium pseudotuberculosis]|uniref:ATP-binding cassette domain-containing protein n=1 Tax=Corynebacterium pseudotuberculosis 258 TaxID=1168865 RepID=A0AAU8PNU3_CORPS|nr:ABC transporter ATP-binding protein [Corynebacterium pseudotuberculosis]AER69642.1 ABC transporter ATP-binding protein [Corynebacterium pseudotuberculosis 1/06-A]AEQ07157.1 ATP-binding cassette domain-containing protein [Corynebacterium pseudotuberculosis CIP 52.97]AFB72966.1 ATP-binding cassette domain-containing protein [Corynebacterium pseudotuberculosis 316]AFH91426.1 ATP-binding cassette domain-containing protein [Corynebacterium pseudotuberculosis 31]AFK17257.1 ATP-binding cassette do
MNTPVIQVSALTKSFHRHGQRGFVAVDHVSFSVPQGQIVAFLGPNGAGKSTTIDMILGLSSPDSGHVKVLGGSPQKATCSGQCQAVLQSGGLLPDFTVRETVQAVASAHGVRGRVKDVIKRWDLDSYARRKVGKCSGGQQQRLRFALAMLSDPQVLILDEPTAGLDVEARRKFWRIMREEADAGRTILFATHYIEEADDFAERVIFISEGKIVADGPIEKIRASVRGATVSAVVPGASAKDLAGLPGVKGISVNGDRITLDTTQPDDIARYLLNHTSAYDLLVSTTSLEDAFIELTNPRDGNEKDAA